MAVVDETTTRVDGTMMLLFGNPTKENEQENDNDDISTSDTDTSSESDSEEEQGDQIDAFPTGPKRRRGAAAAAAATAAGQTANASSSSSSTSSNIIRSEQTSESNPDPTVSVRYDPSRSKYNCSKQNQHNHKPSSQTQTTIGSSTFGNDVGGTGTTGKTKQQQLQQQQQQQQQQQPAYSYYTLARWLEFLVGCVFFFVPLPLVVCQIVACTLWELADQATFKLTNLGTALNEWCDPYYKRLCLVQHPKDTFVVNTTIWLGVVLPIYFVLEAEAQAQFVTQQEGNNGNGLSLIWWRAALYNIVRIGPMYRHFMFVYVLCHKEAHSQGKLFAMPHRKYLGFQFAYNYFIGFFHGVLPGPFTESHIYNHHKYDNDINDVYSTGAYPRDSFRHFLRYVYVWFLYALNISSIVKFLQEGKTIRAWRCFGGTLYYATGVALCAKLVSPTFAALYIVYPLIEGNILLAAVNYTWHAFIDPNNHTNDYVNSVTILNGLDFTLDEEYHVVHHQYGGVHWSRNKELYYAHIDDYKKHMATVFKDCNLFVIWGMIVAKDYDGLADHFVQYEEDESKKLSKEELAQLLKERLRCTTWTY